MVALSRLGVSPASSPSPPLRVLVTDGESGAVGALIRWYTWSWAAHVAFELADGRVLDATLKRGVAIHATVDGRRVRRYEVDAPADVLRTALGWAMCQVGARYDLRAIAGMPLRLDLRTPKSFFCSELVNEAMTAAGWPLVNAAHEDRVTPRDVAMSTRLRLVE